MKITILPAKKLMVKKEINYTLYSSSLEGMIFYTGSFIFETFHLRDSRFFRFASSFIYLLKRMKISITYRTHALSCPFLPPIVLPYVAIKV